LLRLVRKPDKPIPSKSDIILSLPSVLHYKFIYRLLKQRL